MNLGNATTPLSEVLYEFSLARTRPDAELLDQFVRRYPEHADALTDLAIGIVLDTARGDDDVVAENVDPVVSQAVSRAMSRFQNKLFEMQQKQGPAVTGTRASTSSAENPFATLGREEFRALAKGLHCNTVFVGMLRDREIDPNTMSEGFRRQVADEMKAPLELVAAHFAAQSGTPPGQFYKAEGKPRAGQPLSFEEAVRKSGLTEDQQSYLLGL